ncbi:MAG: FG-GAP repeat protein, partial [Verrucomicrobiota bacterium]
MKQKSTFKFFLSQLFVSGLVFLVPKLACAQELVASDGAFGDLFGESVSVSGQNGLVGAFWDDDDGPSSGSAHYYSKLDAAGGTVTESEKLNASNATLGDQFGVPLSLSGDYALIAARNDDNENGVDGGSVY